ncbi:MAG: glycosyltransferase family 2 protein [Nitrososphaera sp.]
MLKTGNVPLSIVLPTYNESQNITRMLDSIAEALPVDAHAEIIVVDDNSPDGTGDIASRHKVSNKKLSIQVIKRPCKLGLSSAILAGVQSAAGQIVVVMDGDFSHPPHTIPKMVEELKDSKYDIVVASRYIKGGSVIGWPFKRRLMSKGATKIAQVGLGIQVNDPMSGFFAFKRGIIEGIKFDAIGYKMLLEILVKAKGARIKEVPYTFTNRRAGASKLDSSVMIDYFRAVWRLYRYGRTVTQNEKRASVRFLSKAGRFYTVGATGLLVNYLVSLLFKTVIPDLWYIYATIVGIVCSISSNFFLNKIWTFEDKDFNRKRTAIQYGLFMGFSSLGALVQLGMVYLLTESYELSYEPALIMGVVTAAVGNFLLNKKWTFKEKIWS